MTVSIPSAAGVPGIGGPPIWFPGELTFDPRLDDVRWRGAVKRAFGSGTGGSNFFRATQATVGAQKFIYLTFRAAFVPALSDNDDLIYFGLRKHGTTAAMVVRITAHGATFTPAVPPSANRPPHGRSHDRAPRHFYARGAPLREPSCERSSGRHLHALGNHMVQCRGAI